MEKSGIQPFACYTDPATLGPRWTRWLTSFELYADGKGLILTNDATDAIKQRRRTLLLHLAGQDVQDVFSTLPQTGEATDYAAAVAALNTYFVPQRKLLEEGPGLTLARTLEVTSQCERVEEQLAAMSITGEKKEGDTVWINVVQKAGPSVGARAFRRRRGAERRLEPRAPGEDLEEFDLKKFSASEEALLKLLPVVKASNKAVLSSCNLTDRSCEDLNSVLSCESFSLKHLDLSNNDLKDSGVNLLSAGLKSPNSELETLSLSGCLISEEGCSSLVSALRLNPNHLRKLDLSYNHPGDSGEKLLSILRQDPDYKLETLRLDHGGAHRLNPARNTYSCNLTVDMNTVNRNLRLSHNNRKVTHVEEPQSYPDHPDRFEFWPQLLCSTGLTGRCYWEVQWIGVVQISVSYRGIGRKGRSEGSLFGCNDQSWSLICSDDGYSVRHNNIETPIRSSSVCHRIGVYVDVPARVLSFYSVSSGSLIHLHTFSTTFTEPLYPGFGLCSGSSVFLCDL
ncbi:uncharacterized protein LOC111568739 [Amphiprion ocellaris]|uniref:uncharacterized protein LOC111568739 n=1 Tax=Amphiprion ocellaris TaxID=80972 RepID=UPI0024111314|nr:uncharacterized protein LOC111568739 [Amphiprion ocellaris]